MKREDIKKVLVALVTEAEKYWQDDSEDGPPEEMVEAIALLRGALALKEHAELTLSVFDALESEAVTQQRVVRFSVELKARKAL